LVRLIVERFSQILRCYDSVGRLADGELLLILPGCSLFHAKTLAERIRDGVFGSPLETCGEEIRLNACFGVVSSGGRSPFVVLRETRKALQRAQTSGPGSIHWLGAAEELDSGKFLIPVLQEESLDGNRR
jgi:GGDEF domain-containing protein